MALEQDSALSRYMTYVQNLPRLTREQERELTRRWYENADTAARDELIACHLRFVVAIALKYRRYGLPLSELVSEGNYGLVYALKKFEPERGLRFVTYAAYWIRAYVLNHIIRSWSLVGVGSGALRSKMFFKLRRERVRIVNLVGEGEQADELLAKQFNLPSDEVAAMLRRLETRDLSLDTKVFDDSGLTLLDALPATGQDQESRAAQTERDHQLSAVVQAALKQLDTRERFIAEQRFMADPEEALSLAEIGRRLGISRERARQLETRAKKKLRYRIEQLSEHAELVLDAAA